MSDRISIKQLRDDATAPNAICPQCGGSATINAPHFDTIAPTQHEVLALVEAVEAAENVAENAKSGTNSVTVEMWDRLDTALARFDFDDTENR